MARAEAEAANLLERAGRDAEAIRQEARLENPGTQIENDAITQLADQVGRLERKLTKQRRKLDEITHGAGPAVRPTAGRRRPSAARVRRGGGDPCRRSERRSRSAAPLARTASASARELVGLLDRSHPPDEDQDGYY